MGHRASAQVCSGLAVRERIIQDENSRLRWKNKAGTRSRSVHGRFPSMSPQEATSEQHINTHRSYIIIIIIIINGIYIALSSQVAMQLGNGAANALKQLGGIKQMSFQSVSKNSH